MVKGRFSLPDRWRNYDAVGNVIPGTRFIAFKVPLMLQYFHRKGLEREMFTTSDLNEKLGDKLRLVVDLSCKQVGMYYNPEDLEKNGIRYEKLRVEGKKVPSEHIIKRFKLIVTEFEKRQPRDYYIGVHCTHGVNRTGYVICRYMIEQLSKTTDEALRAFKAGRGYPLERENYIEALHKFEKDARVVKDMNTGHSKGYGFVAFAKESDAENAMKQMSGAVLGGKPIRTNWASRKKNQSKGEAKEYKSVFDKTSKSNTTVYIGNTPDSFSETEVRNMFDTFGQILEVRVYPDRNYAFVKYSDHDQAAQAIVGCHGQTVRDRPIRCDWAKEDSQPKDAENAMKQMSGAVRGGKPIRTNWASRKKNQSKGEAKQYKSVFDKTSESNTTVYIGNTPDCFSETEVRNMFDTFGQILEVRVYPDRNYAFVKYSDHDQAAQAIVGCHGQTVRDRPIRCDWGKEDNQPKGPGSVTQPYMQQQQQQQQQQQAYQQAALLYNSFSQQQTPFQQQPQQQFSGNPPPGMYSQQQYVGGNQSQVYPYFDSTSQFPGYGQDGSHSTFMGQGSNSAATSQGGFGYQQQ